MCIEHSGSSHLPKAQGLSSCRNVCLRVNSVTFFQLSKIMITPGLIERLSSTQASHCPGFLGSDKGSCHLGVVILQALLFNKVCVMHEAGPADSLATVSAKQRACAHGCCGAHACQPTLGAQASAAISMAVQVPSRQEMASIVVLCMGVGLATVSGAQVDTTLVGAAVAIAAIGVTSIYQVQPCCIPLAIISLQGPLPSHVQSSLGEHYPTCTLRVLSWSKQPLL